jgi:CheY-like chemotaxis protein
MAVGDGRAVLIVEDDKYWRNYLVEHCRERGWSVTALTNAPKALRIIKAGEKMFSIALVDARSGKTVEDPETGSWSHVDGLDVIRALHEYQPFCIRVLDTALEYSYPVFGVEHLGLHLYWDKSGDIDKMFDVLDGWKEAPLLERPVVLQADYRSRREKGM